MKTLRTLFLCSLLVIATFFGSHAAIATASELFFGKGLGSCQRFVQDFVAKDFFRLLPNFFSQVRSLLSQQSRNCFVATFARHVFSSFAAAVVQAPISAFAEQEANR